MLVWVFITLDPELRMCPERDAAVELVHLFGFVVFARA